MARLFYQVQVLTNGAWGTSEIDGGDPDHVTYLYSENAYNLAALERARFADVRVVIVTSAEIGL
jgi:hypothetical protein